METSFFDRIKGYKTLFVNAVVMGLALLQAFGVVEVVPGASEVQGSADNIIGGAAAIYAGVNIWLRWVTTTGIMQSE